MALLLVSVGVAGVGAVNAHRTHRSHRATAEALIRDYGTFAAWSFGNGLGEALGRSLDRTLSNALGAAQRRATTQQCLNTLLVHRSTQRCDCGGTMAGPGSWAFHVTLGTEGPTSFYQGPAPPAAVRERMLSEIVAHTRETFNGRGHRFGLRWVGDEGAEVLMAVATTAAFSGDTVVYGVQVDPERYRATFRATMERTDLLPRSLQQDRDNGEMLAIEYTTADGRVLYRSTADAPIELSGEHVVADPLGGGAIRASVLPGVADDLIIGGLPRTRVPDLLFLFGLSGVLALLAVFQLRKEAHFARERQDFVAGVSHELRTPLTQIRLFVETLRLGRMRTAPEREWALATIDRETLRLTRLVENILHFSRAERGVAEVAGREPADLRSEAEAVVASFAPLLRPRQAELVVDVPAGVQVELHRDGFRQVLLNLLDNAVKYGPVGQTVRVGATVSNGRVRLTVDDEGPGVPEADRRAIFEPFRRGADALGGVVTGSGIGLAVVREIAAAHEGRVWVEPGRGARFVVELPLLRTVSVGRLRGGAEPAPRDGARDGGPDGEAASDRGARARASSAGAGAAGAA